MDKAQKLQSVVDQVWNSPGAEWMAMLRAQLAWNDSIDQTIKANWTAYRRAARQQGKSASPQEFARMFADAIWNMSQEP